MENRHNIKATLITIIILLMGFFLRQNEGVMEIITPLMSQISQQETASQGEDAVIQGEDWYESVPEFKGTPYVEVNHNVPFFKKDQLKRTDPFEYYSDLDDLGRCGPAYANICEDLMPTEEREAIGKVKPSGWVQKYHKVNGKSIPLYNRSHLIAFSLAGENANEKNLVTGTDYMNHDGMIPFETTVRDYIYDHPSRHVLYRVTPVFEGNELVCRGVLMEAWSVEDNGYGVQFCVFCYNVQPDNTIGTKYKLINIDYATGKSKK